jgi:photosystem II stability/assembly factor-like uncharacterized protein
MKQDQNGNVIARVGSGNHWSIVSIDSGFTWRPILINGDSIALRIFLSENGLVLFQNKKEEWYHTGDYGNTWQEVKMPKNLGKIYNTIGFEKDKQAVTITDKRNILYSKDDGRSWTSTGTKFAYGYNAIRILDNGDFLVIMGDGNIYRSKDRGATWMEERNENLGALLENAGRGHLIVMCPSKGLLESLDYGKTFKNLGLPNTFINSIAFETDSSIIVGMYGRCIYRLSREHTRWTHVTSGWSLSPVLCLAFDSSSTIFAGTENSGIYRSTDDGQNWTSVSDSMEDLNIPSITIGRHNEVYALSATGYLLSSNDSGDHWDCLNRGGVQNIRAMSLAIDSGGAIYVGCMDEGVMRLSVEENKLLPLSDSYRRAEKLLYDISTNSFYGIFVEFEPSGEDLHSGDNRLGILYRSTDSCRTWRTLNPKETGVECFAVDKTGGLVIGTDSSGVLRSIDHGRKWQKLGLDSLIISTIAICDSNTIVVGTKEGYVLASTNLGKQWDRIDMGIPYKGHVEFVTLDRQAYLYVGGWHIGISKSIQPCPEVLQSKLLN